MCRDAIDTKTVFCDPDVVPNWVWGSGSILTASSETLKVMSLVPELRCCTPRYYVSVLNKIDSAQVAWRFCAAR